MSNDKTKVIPKKHKSFNVKEAYFHLNHRMVLSVYFIDIISLDIRGVKVENFLTLHSLSLYGHVAPSSSPFKTGTLEQWAITSTIKMERSIDIITIQFKNRAY